MPSMPCHGVVYIGWHFPFFPRRLCFHLSLFNHSSSSRKLLFLLLFHHRNLFPPSHFPSVPFSSLPVRPSSFLFFFFSSFATTTIIIIITTIIRFSDGYAPTYLPSRTKRRPSAGSGRGSECARNRPSAGCGEWRCRTSRTGW